MSSYDQWEDYFWPDAQGVLKNRLGIKDSWKLREAETRASLVRMAEIITDDSVPEALTLDHYCDLHRKLFGDIYDWAGQPRTVPKFGMTKHWRDVVNFAPDDRTAPWTDYVYRPGPEVPSRAASQFTLLNFELEKPENQAPHKFIPIMATCWGGLDQIHPFREGNTRSQAVLFHQVCRKHGYELGGQELFDRREEFIAARFHGHATGQYGRLISLLLETVRQRESEQLSDREREWAESLQQTSQRPVGPGGLVL
ncbi:Fic family protein [Mycolicibacterium thermoresistibile]